MWINISKAQESFYDPAEVEIEWVLNFKSDGEWMIDGYLRLSREI